MSNTRAIVSILSAFSAGVLIGVLTAPDKGAVTRSKIAEKGKGLVKDLNESISANVRTFAAKVKRTSPEESLSKEESVPKTG